MAGFKTHITVSSTLGVGYGLGAFLLYGVPATSCMVAGTLCGLSGMLPDLDSDSGVPLRESLSFTAATAPMLVFERFHNAGWTPETMALAGAALYVSIRFGLSKVIKKLTVHRGMFHSIPAGLIFAGLFYLMAVANTESIRIYKAGGVFAGFMSHLILDEIWSVSFKHGVPTLKSSFGTAVKVWGDSFLANLATYAQLALVAYAIFNDGNVLAGYEAELAGDPPPPSQEAAQQFAEDVWRRVVR